MPIPLLISAACIGAGGMLGNAVSSFISGHKSRDQTRELAQLSRAQQERFEANRQAMQLAQMKFSCLQQAESQAFQAEQGRLNREHQMELEQFRQQVQKELSERNLQFQAWRLEQEQVLQKELAGYARETQLMIVEFQRETARQQPEINAELEAWPLRLVPAVILKDSAFTGNPPLKVLIAPPEVDFDKFGSSNTNTPKLEKSLAEGLRQFFIQYYPSNHAERSVEFIGGAWEAKRFHGEASIKALFSRLKSEPLLILESEIDSDYLNMRFAYWGAAQAQYAYVPVVSRFKFRELVCESAKERARQWKATRDRLLELKKDLRQFNERDTYNLSVLEEEEELAELGVDLSQTQARYKLAAEDFEVLNQFLLLNHQLVAGLVTDTHHLLQHEVKPALLQWLPALLATGVQAEILQSFLAAYQQLLRGIAVERPAWAAELALDLAEHLCKAQQRTWVEHSLEVAIGYYLSARKRTVPEGLTNLVQALKPALIAADESVVRRIQACLNYLQHTKQVEFLQLALIDQQRIEREQKAEEKRKEAARLKAVEERKAREEAARLEAERKAREEAARLEAERLARDAWKPKWASQADEDEYGRYADLTVKGVSQRFRWIEAGTFMMGSPTNEVNRYDDETLHLVNFTQGYWLADTACTQAFWEKLMGNNPAYFSDNLQNPVERVSWEDVQGFISKLNQQIVGIKARLPTEAEWEYACRAGTTTPFSFGATITPEQANYNGNYPYAGGRSGVYRKKTVPVKSLPANPWGVYGMHGNVWEWCQDWYGAYPSSSASAPKGPSSGTVHVLRGGSWYNHGQRLRSANRHATPDYRNHGVGFRLSLG